MKKINVLHVIFLVGIGVVNSLYGAGRGDGDDDIPRPARHRLPDRPPAHRHRRVCCGLIKRSNPAFKDDELLLKDIVDALAIVNPQSLQALHRMSQGTHVVLTPEQLFELRGLGLLNHLDQVKESWAGRIRRHCDVRSPSEESLLAREIPPMRKDISFLGCLCCKSSINQAFLKALNDLEYILNALRIANSSILCQLYFKTKSYAYPLTPHAHAQLSRLGFLELNYTAEGTWQVRENWRPYINLMLATEIHNFDTQLAMEDLNRRFPDWATLILERPAGIGSHLRSVLTDWYGIDDPRTKIPTLQDYIRNAQDESQFSTLVRIKPLEESFFDLGMLVDVVEGEV